MALKLYEVTSAYNEIRALAEEGGEEESWAQALADLKDLAEPKVLTLARLVREQQAIQAALRTELDRLNLRMGMAARAEGRLLVYIKETMELMEWEKVGDATIGVTLQRNSQPSASISDPSAVLNKYVLGSLRMPLPEWPAELRERLTSDYDKRAMLDAHKRGEAVEGVEFVEGHHVRIR